MAVQPSNKIPDVNRKIGPLTKSDLRLIEEDLANILKYNAFMSDSFTYFIKASKEDKKNEEEDRKGSIELRRAALRTSIATEESNRGNRKMEKSTLSYHKTSERQGSDMIRSMHGLSRGLEKFSPGKQLDQINSMMINSSKAYEKLGSSYIDMHKAILEEQSQEKEKVYSEIMKSIKEQMEELLANNEKLQTEEGQARLKELAEANKKMLDLQKKEGKSSRSSFGGKSKGRGRSSFGDDEDSGFAGDWMERTKERIKKSFVDKMVEVTEPLKKGKEFITGKKTKTKFEKLQEKLEEKRLQGLEQERLEKEKQSNLTNQPILSSVIDMLGIKEEKKQRAAKTKKSSSGSGFASKIAGDSSSSSKDIPTVKTIEQSRKQKKYTPTAANVKKNNPEIFWLARGDVKESDETQTILKDIKEKSGGSGKGTGVLDILATVGSAILTGVKVVGGALFSVGKTVAKVATSTAGLAATMILTTPSSLGESQESLDELAVKNKKFQEDKKKEEKKYATKDEQKVLSKSYSGTPEQKALEDYNTKHRNPKLSYKDDPLFKDPVYLDLNDKAQKANEKIIAEKNAVNTKIYERKRKEEEKQPSNKQNIAPPPMQDMATVVDTQSNIQKKTVETVANSTDTKEMHKMWIQEAFQSITDAFIQNTQNIGAAGLGAVGTSQTASSKGEMDRSEDAREKRKEAGGINDGIVRNDGTVVKINEKDNVYATTKNLEVDKRSSTNNTDNRKETKIFAQPNSTTMAQASLGSAREAGIEVAKASLMQQQDTNKLIEKLITVITKSGNNSGTTVINNQTNDMFSVGTIMQKLGGA